jgi:glycerol-3-phosphate dehydrogenase
MIARRSASLNAARRNQELQRVAGGEHLDVLVIGGGVTGAGIALDAASRGLSVALVERRDLANGTSRWSSKLAHGGLRYLRQLEVGVAWESARERHVLMTRTAPHLVRPLPFVAPLDSTTGPVLGALTETALRVGDVMRIASGTSGGVLPAPRRISRHEALRLTPATRSGDLRGGLLFWDGQLEDDARLVIAIARTAAAHGARILTYCEATDVAGDRAVLHDQVSAQRFEVHATHVINAAGVWADRLAPGVRLRPSKGSHLIVRAAALGDPRAAIIAPVPGASARWVGATPGSDWVIVGLTDDEYTGPIVDEPEVTAAEREFMLGVLNRSLERPLTRDDVIGGYAGFRPLLAGREGSTADLSRRHAIVRDPDSGVHTVVGGKLTTYRRMAQDAVDAILGHSAPRCRTQSLPLVGAASLAVLQRVDAPERLLRRYGIEAPAVARLAVHDPSLLEPVAPGVQALGVELLFGVRHEGALTVSDLLDRRVRAGLVPEQRRAAEQAAAATIEAAAA